MNQLIETIHGWWNSLTASMMSGAGGVGVYLEEGELTLVQVEKQLGRIKSLNSLRLPFDPDHPEEVLPALRATVAAWQLTASPVSLAVSAESGFLQACSLPVAAAPNLAQVVAYELDRFLPLPGDHLYHAFQVLRQTETDIHFMLLAVPRQRVEPILKLLKEADLQPVALTLAPIAAANAFVYQIGKRAPASWLLLHTTPDGFELTHLEGTAIQSYCQKKMVSKRDFFDVLKNSLSGKIGTVSELTSFCMYGMPRKDAMQRLKQQYDFELTYPSEEILPGFFEGQDPAKQLTAFGAAVFCLGKPAVGTNLLPESEREPVSFRKFTLINALVISLLSFCLIWAGSALIHKRFRLYQVNRQIAQLTPEVREVENLLKEGRALAEQMNSLRALSATPDKLVILKNLTQIIPSNTWLYSVRLSKQVLEISGTSQSASELIPTLEKSGWLRKTEFVSPIVTDANKNEQFKIKAEIKGLEPAPR